MKLEWDDEQGDGLVFHWAQGQILRWTIEHYEGVEMYFVHIQGKTIGVAQDLKTAKLICQAYETDNPRPIKWIETDDIHMDSTEAMRQYRILIQEGEETLYRDGKMILNITLAGKNDGPAGQRACRLASLMDGLTEEKHRKENKE